MALAASLCLSASIDTPIRSVVQVLPRTADVLVLNDSHIDECEPGTFRDKVKHYITLSVRYNLQGLYIYQSTDTPNCRVFNAALFSASAVKSGLLDQSFIYAFTRYGLQLPPFEPFENENMEAVAIGAVRVCLQVITAGGVFMEKHFAKMDVSLADIIAALEALKVKRLIDHRGALELLDKTIEAAKDNFANPLSVSDAWKLLGIFRM